MGRMASVVDLLLTRAEHKPGEAARLEELSRWFVGLADAFFS